tara:strand:+ start:1243 stop:1977 length:735 start_codon:yes stop_codon:yes gene_type:complete
MQDKLLFIFEGASSEKEIMTSVTNHFTFNSSLVQCVFDADIYQLYKLISADEDLDTFTIIKNRFNNKNILDGYTRKDFAEIYLFFDYDGHDTFANDDSISDLLRIFNQETETGKLFISYPMVEAIKHLGEHVDFKNLKVKCKENIRYKKIAGEIAPHHLQPLKRFTRVAWCEILNEHLRKMNFIVNDNFVLPVEYTSQDVIFQNQLDKYINIDETVAVLSSFPIFLFDYYGFEKTSNFINDNNN